MVEDLCEATETGRREPQGPCSRGKDSALVRYAPEIKSLL